MHCVPHVMLHQAVYILLRNGSIGGLEFTKSGGFPEKRHVSLCVSSIQLAKSSYMYVIVGYFTLNL